MSLKVLREDRTFTNNKRLFGRILEKPYFYRYKILTLSSIIQQLILTKKLGAINKALWLDIVISKSQTKVTLGAIAREASTNARVGISC